MDNLIGKKFGRLTVLERDLTKKRYYYICKCDCGNIEGFTLREISEKYKIPFEHLKYLYYRNNPKTLSELLYANQLPTKGGNDLEV